MKPYPAIFFSTSSKHLCNLALAMLTLITATSSFAQTGVKIASSPGTAHASAMLDVESVTKGVLIPRMSAAERIAIASPATGLLVYQTDGSSGVYYYNGTAWVQLTAGGLSGAGVTNYITRWTSSSGLGTGIIYDNGTNVGIGTTSPLLRLSILGGIGISEIGGLGNRLQITSTGAGAEIFQADNSGIIFKTGSGVQEKMRIMDNGNVGIATSAPDRRFQVFSTGTGSFEMKVGHGTPAQNASLDVITTHDAIGFQVWDDNNLVTPRFIVQRGGNVGVGVAAPAFPFEVNGAARIGSSTSGALTISSLSANRVNLRPSVGNGDITITDDSGQEGRGLNVANNGFVGIRQIGTTAYALQVNGATASVGFVNTSDARFKKNIQPISNALSKTLALNGVSYQFRREEFQGKDFDTRTHTGFLAQEVKEVLPDAVYADNDGYYGVNYDMVIPVLTEAIEEQQALITQQQMEIEELKKVVEQLKVMIGGTAKAQ